MYIVTLDGNYLHHPELDDIQVYDAKLELKVNTSGSFAFTMYPSHPLYNAISKLKSIVEVFHEDELIYRGRPLNDTTGLYKEVTVQCEGTLAYLNDSVVRPYSYFGSVSGYLQLLINSHNSQVESAKQITLGTVTVESDIVRSSINHASTWAELKEKTFNSSLGGYVFLRRLDGVNYLDYLSDSQYQSSQSIELTKNILDYQQEVSADDIATVLIPLGAKLLDEEGNETDERLTIGSVNDGQDYIEHLTGIAKYGRVWGYQIWDDVTIASNLLSRAQSTLNTLVNLGVSIEIRAVDLSMVENINRLRYFEYVRIKSEPHLIDEMMLIKKQSIDINNPAQNIIELGSQYTTFTERQIQRDNAIRKIEADYVTNKQVAKIRNDVVVLSSSITQNAEEITLQTSRVDGLEVDITTLEVTVQGVRTEVSALGGGNIISNIIGEYGITDWTFDSSPWTARSSSPYVELTSDINRLSINDNGPIMYPVATDTLAKKGFKFWHEGKALSRPARVESGAEYSLYTRYKGTGQLTFKVREYNVVEPTNKNSFITETTLGTTNITSEWNTFNDTLTIGETTLSVILVIESDTNIYEEESIIFTDTSFNMGQPRPYAESLTDINTKAEYAVTVANQTADGFSVVNQQVLDLGGRVANTETSLNLQADQLELRVRVNDVVSSINQSSETIKIDANKINLAGYVTISALATAGQTTIHGGNITTGYISASRIEAKSITGAKMADGTIGTIQIANSAITGAKIANSTISSSNIANSAITNAKIANSTIEGGKIANATITGAKIANTTITGAKISGGTITNVQIADSTIINSKIANNAVTAGKTNVSNLSSMSSALGTVSSGSYSGYGYMPSGTLAGNSFSRSGSLTNISNGISTWSLYGQYATLGTGNPAGVTTLAVTGLITSNGSVITSDIRLKENFVDVHDEFNNVIYSLPIGTYNYKGANERSIGINANFVDNMLPKEYTEYFITKDEAGFYSANYTALVPMLVKVVQSQNTRLIDLEHKLKQVEGGIYAGN